jgi:hypothetical protein
MAIKVPSWEEMPKVASLPVSEANSPILMVSAGAPAAPPAASPAGLLQPASSSEIVTAVAAPAPRPNQFREFVLMG